MPGLDELWRSLQSIGLGGWCTPLEPLLESRFAPGSHGDSGKWQAVLDELPVISGASVDLDSAAVTAADSPVTAAQREEIRELLLCLSPWRKGPFHIHGIEIDTEWRSNLKWDRLAGQIAPLAGRRVLDVGCGNGYYAYRMIGSGAGVVVGIDPTLLYVFQFLALNQFLAVPHIHLMPLRLNELPDDSSFFDTTFSMGVLYHQRDPHAHLAELRQTLRPGGELVLETLVYPGDGHAVHEPDGRYARMRNVWHLPTTAALERWLQEAGFRGTRLVDVTVTSVNEQRTTEWMPFESLDEALDSGDPDRTVEGLPAPRRALVIANAP